MANSVEQAPPWSHHRVEVNGIRLHYRRAGSGGEPMLLHGFLETSHAWLAEERPEPVVAELRRFFGEATS